MENSTTFRRLALESIAIVGSILLAFAIDAWWEKSQDRNRQAVQLSLLKQEVLGNIDQLEKAVEFRQIYAEMAGRHYRALTGMEKVSSPELSELKSDLTIPTTLLLQVGTLSFLAGSGAATLVDRPLLRAKLADLQSYIALYNKNEQGISDTRASNEILFHTGSYAYNWPLGKFEPSKSATEDRAEKELAIKSVGQLAFVYQQLLIPQGQEILQDFEEVAAMLE